MSNIDRKNEGTLEEVGGKIKRAVGAAMGNERMRAEGEAQQLRGTARKEEAKAAERTEGAIQELAGKIKNRVGALFGHRRVQAEGRADEIRGEQRQIKNRPSAPSFP